MDIFSLKRKSQIPQTESKKLKNFSEAKQVLTTNAETDEIRLLSKFSLIQQVKPFPLELNDQQTEDPEILELMESIKAEFFKISTQNKDLEENFGKEDEILSRLSERKQFLHEQKETHEKMQKELDDHIKELAENISFIEKEIENNENICRIKTCNAESGAISLNKLNEDAYNLTQNIENLIAHEKFVKLQSNDIDNSLNEKLDIMNFLKENIRILIFECNLLHQIFLSDQDSIMKIKEEILAFNDI